MPLPPPTTGFSNASKSVCSILKYNNIPFKIFNKSSKNIVDRFLLPLFLVFNFYRLKKIYIAQSAGLGLYYDYFIILLASLLKVNVIIHHHSFSYIIKRDPLLYKTNQIFPYYTRKLNHIFLCPCMRRQYFSIYSTELNASNSVILSNISLIDNLSLPSDFPNINLLSNKFDGKINIGILSNLTKEKGIMDFLVLVKYLNNTKYSSCLNFHVGGPCSPDIYNFICASSSDHPNLTYYGPIYGKDKDLFFETVDIFVFPTLYANEAEPLVLYEALKYGSFVFSYQRGCIGNEMSSMIATADSLNSMFSMLVAFIDEIHLAAESYLASQRMDRISIYREELSLRSNQVSQFLNLIY